MSDGEHAKPQAGAELAQSLLEGIQRHVKAREGAARAGQFHEGLTNISEQRKEEEEEPELTGPLDLMSLSNSLGAEIVGDSFGVRKLYRQMQRLAYKLIGLPRSKIRRMFLHFLPTRDDEADDLSTMKMLCPVTEQIFHNAVNEYLLSGKRRQSLLVRAALAVRLEAYHSYRPDIILKKADEDFKDNNPVKAAYLKQVDQMITFVYSLDNNGLNELYKRLLLPSLGDVADLEEVREKVIAEATEALRCGHEVFEKNVRKFIIDNIGPLDYTHEGSDTDYSSDEDAEEDVSAAKVARKKSPQPLDQYDAIFWAIAVKDVPLFESILNEEVFDVNSFNSEGKTLLHAACEKGLAGAVRILLERGASIDIEYEGMSVRHHYERDCYTLVVDKLLWQTLHGDDAEYYDSTQDIIVRAVYEDNAGLVEEMAKLGQSVNLVNSEEGKTLLHVACELGFAETVKVLLKAGASVDTVDFGGRSVRMCNATLDYCAEVENQLSLHAPPPPGQQQQHPVEAPLPAALQAPAAGPAVDFDENGPDPYNDYNDYNDNDNNNVNDNFDLLTEARKAAASRSRCCICDSKVPLLGTFGTIAQPSGLDRSCHVACSGNVKIGIAHVACVKNFKVDRLVQDRPSGLALACLRELTKRLRLWNSAPLIFRDNQSNLARACVVAVDEIRERLQHLQDNPDELPSAAERTKLVDVFNDPGKCCFIGTYRPSPGSRKSSSSPHKYFSSHFNRGPMNWLDPARDLRLKNGVRLADLVENQNKVHDLLDKLELVTSVNVKKEPAPGKFRFFPVVRFGKPAGGNALDGFWEKPSGGCPPGWHSYGAGRDRGEAFLADEGGDGKSVVIFSFDPTDVFGGNLQDGAPEFLSQWEPEFWHRILFVNLPHGDYLTAIDGLSLVEQINGQWTHETLFIETLIAAKLGNRAGKRSYNFEKGGYKFEEDPVRAFLIKAEPDVTPEDEAEAVGLVDAHLGNEELFRKHKFSSKCWRCRKVLDLSEQDKLTWKALRQFFANPGGRSGHTIRLHRLECCYLASEGLDQCAEVVAEEDEEDEEESEEENQEEAPAPAPAAAPAAAGGATAQGQGRGRGRGRGRKKGSDSDDSDDDEEEEGDAAGKMH